MNTTLVETTSGNVRGFEQGSITVWKGIPFASPPLAHRRFLPLNHPNPGPVYSMPPSSDRLLCKPHAWGMLLPLMEYPYRSYTHLVITAHQHDASKTSIRSHSDFWKCLRSSATFDSPNVC
ncbi:MAG TPA: carboxylesterase family protein [Ktedonobacteraceae bacterium]|nr:carboxylesterase family protein [Ktedonobacteraceae bacterium]